MINLNIADLARALMTMILAFFSSWTQATPAHVTMLSQGDTINGMTLTNGVAEARPLWFFCSSKESNNVTAADCRVPQATQLGVGHVFLGSNEAFKDTDWSDLSWSLSIDGRPVNLKDFGTYDYVLPTMAPNPSLVREIFMKFTGWDVVLTNLQPGTHTIEGQVRSDNEQYGWIVKLVIEDRSLALERSLASNTFQNSESGCPKNERGVLSFQHGCRVYG
jgi:hypothetical protein